MLSASKNENDPENMRKEPRFITNAKGMVTAIGAPTDGPSPVTIVDVSRSGLQIELNKSLQKGVQVKVEFNNLIVIGQVLNVRCHASGFYRMGVFITEVAESHHISLHALDHAVGESPRRSARLQKEAAAMGNVHCALSSI